MRIKDINKTDRPREKMLMGGASSLEVSELLAIIISYGSSASSVLDLSNEIIEKAGGVRGLADLTLSDLMSIKGIGESKATKICAAFELSKRIAKLKSIERYNISSPESVADIYMQELRYEKKEIVKLLLIATNGNLVGDVTISQGSLNSSVVHPREVFKEAILRSANKIILVHNHPSGDPTPSKEDVDITKRICEAGSLIGIELVDHIIIGDGEYISLRERGYII